MSAAHLLTDVVTIAALTGKQNSGDPTYGTQSTVKARVEHRHKLMVDSTGRERQIDTVVTSESEIKLSDRVWLPGDSTGDNNAARRPVATAKASTPGGYVLHETYF